MPEQPLNPHASVPPLSHEAIYVLQTPSGEGAIATFILDGDRVPVLLEKILHTRQPLYPVEKGKLVLGRMVDALGKLVDEVVVAPIDPKESPSAMDRVEISCHGGMGVSAAVVRALEEAGFRPGWYGELEARAHRAGRLSLPALEAQFRLTRNVSARQAEFLLGHVLLQERWERIGMYAALGARQRQTAWRDEVKAEVARALVPAGAGVRLIETHRVAVVGPVNAGKSTLVNALLRSDESIVSDTPGTTRDHLVRPAHLRGLSVLIGDTAGLRRLDEATAQAEVEREGQSRARTAVAEADLVLYLMDGTRAPTGEESDDVEHLLHGVQQAEPGGGFVIVLNKSDLGSNPEADGLGFALGVPSYAVSALTGEGMATLECALEQQLLRGAGPASGTVFTRRQVRCLEALRDGLEESLDAVELIGHIRSLVGTRPNEEELAAVFREAAE